MDHVRNFIDGEWLAPQADRWLENRNPADWNELLGEHPRSDAADVGRAVAAAERAFPEWSRKPAPARAEILARAARLLGERKEELAVGMCREMGKVLSETRGDVQEAIDIADYMAGEGRRLFGQTTPSELPNKFCMTVRRPVGVCGLITPWNFPAAIPAWKMFPALLCGNTVVLKPAEDTPWSATRLIETLHDAGVPPGVINLVHGTGEEVGQALVEAPQVRLISFTGSCETGAIVASRCGALLKRTCLEMGGKNGQIVLADADLDLAVDGALWGGFGTSGQRCTATSRVILERPIAEAFRERFLKRVGELRVGSGLEPHTQVGPIINQVQLRRIDGYVRLGETEGAELLCGGRIQKEGPLSSGWFYAPTVFGKVAPQMRIAREEIFGPVVCLLTVDSFDEAVQVLNDTRFGLSSSLYTRDVQRAFQAIERIEAGITYINGPTIGAEVHLPFGGVKNTGNGHREAGQAALDVFTEWKSVYVDYSGKLQRAQIDNRPVS